MPSMTLHRQQWEPSCDDNLSQRRIIHHVDASKAPHQQKAIQEAKKRFAQH